MPRTKVSKSSKRIREISNREEKIRELEVSLDNCLIALENKGQAQMKEVEARLRMLVQRTNWQALQIPMGDFMEMNLSRLDDWQQHTNAITPSCSSINPSQSLQNSTKLLNPNDEGYLTEDSSNGGGGSAIGLPAATLAAPFLSCPQSSSRTSTQQLRGRTPGPLNSARARRLRRSRSADEDYAQLSTIKPKPNAACNNLDVHASRSKMRTPIAARTKAYSADRTPQMSAPRYSTSGLSPPTAFMRWPKPGELVLSQCGSPVVAQVMPDKYANVNIPIRNGVLSLRPKKLAELKPDIIESIDPETLKQIKTLHANLNLIMKMADNAALK